MLLLRRRLNRGISSGLKNYLSTIPQRDEVNIYTETPEYPEILDLTFEKREQRKRKENEDKIQNLSTIEEKQIKINMPRYYGYQATMLTDEKFPYNCMPLTQHYTRTLFEESGTNFPDAAEKNEKDLQTFVDFLKAPIEEALCYGLEYFNSKYNEKDIPPREQDRILGKILVQQMNRTLINSLSADYNHLAEVEIDIEPRHECFWYVGGINPTKRVKKIREGRRSKWEKDKQKPDDPTNRPVQYIGKPYLALRHRLPLQCTESNFDNNLMNDKNLNTNIKVPKYKYDARVTGYNYDYRHGTNIPGFWPGSRHEFGLISYQPRDYVLSRDQNYGSNDLQETFHSHAMQSSFAWLCAQACFQGFTTFNDITYPLKTQTIITNGKLWSFYVYQLNTIVMNNEHFEENPKVNFCKGTKEMKLYEEIDIKSGKCVGLNENVLKNLIKMYINTPMERKDINLKPYLGEQEQNVADIEHDERREFLEKTYKHIMANKRKHLQIPEIYLWEKIYKIDNKTRPLEAKRRFFELGIDPFRRALDDHAPVYVPRALRPDVKKNKNRFKKTYYP